MAAAHALRPGLRFVLMSGSISKLSEPDLNELGVTEVLHKPLSYARLAAALHHALHGSSRRVSSNGAALLEERA